jgi:hypothetical protein
MSSNLPGVDGFWQLIGSADFNHDLRPDLVWANVFGDQAVIWYMNGTSQIGSLNLSLPSGFVGQLVASASQTSNPPAIMVRNFSTGENRLLHYSRTGSLLMTTTMPAVTDNNWMPRAAGHYHPNNLSILDIAWQYVPTGGVAVWAANTSHQFTATGSWVTGVPSSNLIPLQGAH